MCSHVKATLNRRVSLVCSTCGKNIALHLFVPVLSYLSRHRENVSGECGKVGATIQVKLETIQACAKMQAHENNFDTKKWTGQAWESSHSSLRSGLCVLSLTPLNLNEKELVSVFSLLPTFSSATALLLFSVAPASSVTVRLVNRFAVGLWCFRLFLGPFIGWWCSVEFPSCRSHRCAFCPHYISSPGLLCSALCSGRQVLCTSCPPRLHGHVLQHCVCVVRAWLLMFSGPS